MKSTASLLKLMWMHQKRLRLELMFNDERCMTELAALGAPPLTAGAWRRLPAPRLGKKLHDDREKLSEVHWQKIGTASLAILQP